MILVDTSVWIDHLRGSETAEADFLARALPDSDQEILLADIVLLELLQGTNTRREMELIERTLDTLTQVEVLGFAVARKAADNYRTLRTAGCTPRRTADLIIGTWCIENDVVLLQRDRDFLPLVRYCGLRVVNTIRH